MAELMANGRKVIKLVQNNLEFYPYDKSEDKFTKDGKSYQQINQDSDGNITFNGEKYGALPRYFDWIGQQHPLVNIPIYSEDNDGAVQYDGKIHLKVDANSADATFSIIGYVDATEVESDSFESDGWLVAVATNRDSYYVGRTVFIPFGGISK